MGFSQIFGNILAPVKEKTSYLWLVDLRLNPKQMHAASQIKLDGVFLLEIGKFGFTNVIIVTILQI